MSLQTTKKDNSFLVAKRSAEGKFFLELITPEKKKQRVEKLPDEQQPSTSAAKTTLNSSLDVVQRQVLPVEQPTTASNKASAPIIVKGNPSCTGLELFEKVRPFLFQGPNALKSAVPKTQDNLLLLFASSLRERDEIKQRLANKDQFTLQEPDKKKPKILAIGVLIQDKKEHEISENIGLHNDWRPGQYKLIRITKSRLTKKGRTANLIIEIEPDAREKLEDTRGKILFDGNGYKFKDIFSVKQCSCCHRLGHTAQQCRSPPNCRFCAKRLHQDCPAREERNLQNCISCKISGHYSTDPSCPKLADKIKEAKSNVDYSYKNTF